MNLEEITRLKLRILELWHQTHKFSSTPFILWAWIRGSQNFIFHYGSSQLVPTKHPKCVLVLCAWRTLNNGLKFEVVQFIQNQTKKNLLLNEIDTLPCCKEVSWVMRCTMYNPTIWMITFSLQAQIPWFILEPFNWRWLNSPKVFLVCEISWAPKGGLRSNMLWKNNPKKRPIQTWFQGKSYYLVLFQLASLSFLVFYVTPNNYGKCSRTLNNNFTWAHMEFMCCCQAAIVWAFIQ